MTEHLRLRCTRLLDRDADQLLTIAPLAAKKYRFTRFGMVTFAIGLALSALSTKL